ncbi:unnamed protein product [Microthlaspi erraticum]|uniref:Reverse transcriptase/retrotransposon-derived protein RNase H-like domain-containing protein n=1 Tax=Microthlaspi erraticum TaxID=1685480 RepID=A0A6D2KE26_9BRAS|nr:unnamed protein product [Microthlaspi erraticum]
MVHLFWDLPNDDRMGIYPWLIWYIWKARNDKVMSNVDWDPNEIVTKATAEATAWETAQDKQEVVYPPSLTPVETMISGDRCQVDGAWKETECRAGLGWYYFNTTTQHRLMGACNLRRGISPLQTELDVMLQLPVPKTVKDIRSFLGHAGFYRRFIKDFSKIARPLTRLLCKETDFEFDEECHKSWTLLKDALVSAPIVQAPNRDYPFEIMCDASDYAVGAMLGQKIDKKLNVIYYASKTMDDAQCKYATTEKELLAIVFAFEKFRNYIVMIGFVCGCERYEMRCGGMQQW